MPRYRETRDDHALRYIERVNRLRAGATVQDMRKRAHLTLVFSIKTERRFVNPPDGLRTKNPFSNKGWYVVKCLWWRHLGLLTYAEARRRSLKYIDKIGRLMHDRNEPIVGLRATLVDWSTEKPVPRRILRDPWWYEKTFSGWIINTSRLRAWGMANEHGFTIKDQVNVGKKVQLNDTSTMEGAVSFDVDMVLHQAISSVIASIPNWLRVKSVMQPHSRRFSPIALQRAVITLRSQNFRKRLRSYLDHLYETDKVFAEKLRKQTAKLTMRTEAEHWVREEVNNRLLPLDK